MARPIRFGGPRVPLRAWANAWPAAFRIHFEILLSSYREYVHQHYGEELEAAPAAFRLASPTEVVAVAALGAIWVFSRPAEADSIRVIEAWEHETFSDWDFMERPEARRVEAVGSAFLSGEGWHVLEERNLSANGWLAAIHEIPQFYDSAGEGRRLANVHATQAEFQHLWNVGVQEALQSPAPYEAALAGVRERLAALEKSSNPHRRGKVFEEVVTDLLTAHGCVVERGKSRKGEQVDVFMWTPHLALIECRWEKKPLEVEVVHVLRGKLAKRPANVVGLYVSMSGFTRGAKDDVKDARDRTIFLVDRDDVAALARGALTFQEFWDEKMRALITQYPG